MGSRRAGVVDENGCENACEGGGAGGSGDDQLGDVWHPHLIIQQPNSGANCRLSDTD